VQAYRVSLLDPQMRIEAREDIEADTDEAAISAARKIFEERQFYAGFEVWDGPRMVHRERAVTP
jgi:hypothetical protein